MVRESQEAGPVQPMTTSRSCLLLLGCTLSFPLQNKTIALKSDLIIHGIQFAKSFFKGCFCDRISEWFLAMLTHIDRDLNWPAPCRPAVCIDPQFSGLAGLSAICLDGFFFKLAAFFERCHVGLKKIRSRPVAWPLRHWASSVYSHSGACQTFDDIILHSSLAEG